MRTAALGGAVVLAAVVALAAACNSGTGACPSANEVQPGAACSDEHLQCGYALATPTPTCDGTSTTIASSCTCTHGTWECPDPVACEAAASDDGGGGDEAGDEAGDDAGP